MRFAVDLPNFGEFADPDLIVDLAVAAETAGWDGFFLWDHIVVADGFPVADCWTLLAAIAQATERITVGPMVTPLPRRRPWVLARQATTLDHLSGGRLVVGVGIGFPPDVEFGTFREPTDDRTRAEMLDEGLDVLHGIWSGVPFSHTGSHFAVRRTTFAPPPLQPRIPIWVAAMWPNRRPLRRAARFDGAFPIAADGHTLTPQEVTDIVAYVTRHRTASATFDVTIGGPLPASDTVAAYEEAGVTWYQVGPDAAGTPIADLRAMIADGPPR